MEIEEVVINIMDLDTGNLICSQTAIDGKDSVLNNYIEKIVNKFYSTDCKRGYFEDNNTILSVLKNHELSFVEKSTSISESLFDVLKFGETVVGGDLLIFKFSNDNSDTMFGIFKLDFSSRYTHYLDYEESAISNKLILNKSILPSPSQNINEAVIINMKDNSYLLTEKKYRIKGEKINYFSQLFLKVESQTSTKDSIDMLTETIEEVSIKYSDKPFMDLSKAQSAIYENLDMSGMIEVSHIADSVFEENHSAKNEFIETIKEKGLNDKVEVYNSKKFERKFSKQKFKLSNGIELVIPVEIINNKDIIEFRNEPDGKVSVVINDIQEVINRYK